jgi:hypothetical protein
MLQFLAQEVNMIEDSIPFNAQKLLLYGLDGVQFIRGREKKEALWKCLIA